MDMRHFILGLCLVVGLQAEPRQFTSGERQTHLVELFSSEGCSSCPPAEAWLNGLRAERGLWRDFVPVAFHVNYWDRLGWPDRFASRQFTDRQYGYSAGWARPSVYTPCFVMNGGEWRERAVRTLREPGPKVGTLTVSIEQGRARVEFRPATDQIGADEVQVALLGSGIVSKVKAGENGGATLQHEFIALALETHALVDGKAEFALPVATMEGVPRKAVAVWVTRRGSAGPVQATGGWLE